MRDHGDQFKALSPAQKHGWHLQARRGAELRLREIGDAIGRLENERRLLRAEEASNARRNASNHLCFARMTPMELQEATRFFESRRCREMVPEPGMTGHACAAAAPSVADQNVLEEFAPEVDDEPDVASPWWSTLIARHRQHFEQMVISLEPDATACWYFLYAKQSPGIQTMWLELRRRPVQVDIHRDELDAFDCLEHGRVYDTFPAVFRSEKNIGFPDEPDFDLWVRAGVRFAGKVAKAPHAPVRLEHFLSGKPQAPPAQRTGGEARRRRMSVDRRQRVMDEFNWIDEEDLDDGPTRRRPARLAPPGPLAAPGLHPNEDEEDSLSNASQEAPAEVDAVADIPDDAAWDDDEETYFYARPVYGRIGRGEDNDAVRAICGFARLPARDWCAVYGFPQQAEFSIRAHGRPAAWHLAREMARRGNYFIQLWFNRGDGIENFIYNEVHVRDYEPTAAWNGFVLAHADAAWEAIDRVEAMTPMLGDFF